MSAISASNIRIFKFLSIALLGTCCLVFLVASRNWPFVNDAVLIRYATFLLDRGFAPYRQIYDLNLPGSYLVDWVVKHLLGESAFAWRIFDVGLLAIICWAMFSLARRQSRFAGLYAGLLFALFHARDGSAQLGQRDLTITALLMAASAVLLLDNWPKMYLRYINFGLLVGLAATIKPQAIIFLPAALIPYWSLPRPEPFTPAAFKEVIKVFCLSILSALLPIIGFALWLIREGSLSTFWIITTSLIPLHARIGRHSFLYLLGRCFTASHATLFILAVFLAVAGWQTYEVSLERRRTNILLIYGMGFGLASYMMQLKGYPYHRYPFVAFLFLFVTLEFTHALNSFGKRQFIAVCGLVFGLVLSILYTDHSMHDRGQLPQVASLAGDLNSLGGARLSGNIQCIDTIDGCLAALYQLRLTQSTGILYDEFLFLPPNLVTPMEEKTVDTIKRDFLDRMLTVPPKIVVVTPWLFPNGPNDYQKLDMWPAFNNFLSRCYEMRIERHISGGRSDHPGYRIYIRRPSCK